jgi:hypothetical protein
VLLASGVLIGLPAGLLGIGALAVGTVQASMAVASLTAGSAHWRAGTIEDLSWHCFA